MKFKKITFSLLSAAVMASSSFAHVSENNRPLAMSLIEETNGAESTFYDMEENSVQNYQVTCLESNTLTASVADLGMDGDHWELTAITDGSQSIEGKVSSSGVVGEYRDVTIDQHQADHFTAKVTVKYRSGINDFPAAGEVKFHCAKGDAIVLDLGKNLGILESTTTSPKKGNDQ